jgi:hypothetical protein
VHSGTCLMLGYISVQRLQAVTHTKFCLTIYGGARTGINGQEMSGLEDGLVEEDPIFSTQSQVVMTTMLGKSNHSVKSRPPQLSFKVISMQPVRVLVQETIHLFSRGPQR